MAETHLKPPAKKDQKAGHSDTKQEAAHIFARNEFLNQERSGKPMDKKRRPEDGPVGKEEVEFSKDLEQAYINLLAGYARNLENARKTNLTILDTPGHEHDKQIFTLLTNARGEVSDNYDEIKTFLESPDGWKIATGLIEHNAMMKMFGVGMYEITQNKILPESISISKDGIKFGGPGYTLDAKAAVQTLQYYQNNTNEKDFLKAVWGIDVDDFKIEGDRVVEANPHGAMSTNIKGLQRDISDALNVRKDFYASLGISESDLDRSPGQFLFGRKRRFKAPNYRPEQLSYIPHIALQDAFDMRVNFLDAAGNAIVTPAFDPKNPDIYGNAGVYMDVSSEVLAKMAEDYIKGKEDKESREVPKNVISTLDAKIADRGNPQGDAAKAKAGAFIAERTLTENLQTHLSEEKGSVDAYTQALDALDSARRQVREYTSVPGTTLEDKLNWITAQLNDITVAGSYAHDLHDMKGRKQPQIDAAYAAITYPAKATKETTEQLQREARENVDRIFAMEQLDLDKRLEKLTAMENELKTLRTTISDQEKALVDTSETATSGIDAIDTMKKDFTTIYDLGIMAPDLATLTPAQLLTRINTAYAASVAAGGTIVGWPPEENSDLEHRGLLENAIVYGKAEVNADTDPDRTTRQAALSRLVHWGISENQLRVMQPDQVIAYFNKKHASGKPGWDSRANTAYGPVVEMAIAEAKLHIGHIQAAFSEQDKILQGRKVALTKEINKVDLKQEENMLNQTKNLLERTGYIRSKAQEVVTSSELRRKFFDTTLMNPADPTLTPSERNMVAGGITLAVPMGYYEFLNLFFDNGQLNEEQKKKLKSDERGNDILGYKSSADRDAIFQKISSFMPPDRLAALLRDNLGLTTPGTSLIAMFSEVDGRITAGTMSDHNFSEGLQKLMDQLRNEAMALP